jgi:hypothetical protein
MNSSTPANRIDAHSKPIEKIRPWYGPVRGFSFNREVQPVLDKYCVGCHDGEDKDVPDFNRRGWCLMGVDIARFVVWSSPSVVVPMACVVGPRVMSLCRPVELVAGLVG